MTSARGSISALVFFRIGIGLAVAYTGLSYFREASLWFGDGRIISDELYTYLPWYPHFIVHFRNFLFNSVAVTFVFKSAFVVAGFLLASGIKPRSAAGAAFFLICLTHWPHWFLALPGYYLFQFGVIVLIFYDSKNQESETWCRRFLWTYAINMYISTAIFKMMEPSWISGEAIAEFITARDIMAPWAKALVLQNNLGPLLTRGTLIFEIILPLMLAIPRLRAWGAILGIVFHLGIAITMGIYFFQYSAILYLCLFFKEIPMPTIRPEYSIRRWQTRQ